MSQYNMTKRRAKRMKKTAEERALNRSWRNRPYRKGWHTYVVWREEHYRKFNRKSKAKHYHARFLWGKKWQHKRVRKPIHAER